MKEYKPGSANFESYFLKISQDAIQVAPCRKLLLFFGIFALVGIGIMTVPLYAETDPDNAATPGVLFFGLIFLAAGGGMIAAILRRSYPLIDLYQRMFYPAGRNRRRPADESPAIPLSELEKICISSRLISGSKSHYRCYTLSLRFTGGREFILLNHGSRKSFWRDAELLSGHLGLPLPEDAVESEEKRRIANAKAAIPMMIFGLIWLAMCVPVHLQTWTEQELFLRIFTGIFVAIGLIVLSCAVKLQFSGKSSAGRD